jgi:hypothetical protein
VNRARAESFIIRKRALPGMPLQGEMTIAGWDRGRVPSATMAQPFGLDVRRLQPFGLEVRCLQPLQRF